MKRFLLSLLVIGLCFVYGTYAQERTEETVTTTDSTGNETTVQVVRVSKTENLHRNQNMIVINPLKFFLFYNASYYRALSPAIAVGGGVQIPTISGVSGFGLNGEMRWYPSDRALHGFYVAPNISFNSLSSDADVSSTIFSVGALLGWQWFPGDDFAIGLGIGIDYYSGSVSDDGDASVFGDFDGTVPALRFDIGYGWE